MQERSKIGDLHATSNDAARRPPNKGIVLLLLLRRGKRVMIAGGGIFPIQLLDEISRVTETTWVTRRPVELRDTPFDEAAERAAVKLVENRVRQGLPPTSVVSVTGLPLTPAIAEMQAGDVLRRRPMFAGITPTGIRWADGSEQEADVILWCTGFRSSLDHLAPLLLRGEAGGILLGGRLATEVVADRRIHLVGYGHSARTLDLLDH